MFPSILWPHPQASAAPVRSGGLSSGKQGRPQGRPQEPGPGQGPKPAPLEPTPQEEIHTASTGHQRAKRPQRAQEQAWSPVSLSCHILKTLNPSPKRVPETGGQAGKPETGAEGAASRSTQGRPQRTLRQPPSPGTQGSPSAAQVAVPPEPALLVLGGVTRLAGCI